MRKGGVLLPVSSIPSKYGIGTFSKQAYEFVDFLERAGQSFWQILPLGPTGYGDSPYQSFSTFAGNPYYIDLEELIKKGWLTKEECDACDFGSDDGYVDYEKIYLSRFRILKIAYERSNIKEDKEFGKFKEDNASRHARRRTRFIQLEQLGICPCIGAVKRYINGDIPYNADFLFIGIRLKRQPLNGEHKLLELIKFYFVRKLFFISLHRFGFTEPDVFLPFNPAYPVKGILHRHI